MAAEPSSSAVKLRSIYVSSPGDEIESAAPVEVAPQISDRFEDDKPPPAPSELISDHAKDPVLLPQSTHSLLFTEPVLSAPFAFAVAILVVSFGCLGLAFTDGFQVNDIPVNVTAAVRGAQYLSIIVALLMEEEIPTGLYLLRRISRRSLRQHFPHMNHNYRKFFASCLVRIANGYFFLLNVLMVLVQATGVLDMFYNLMALQFVQQLDDIAFSLAKLDVFGKKLQAACKNKCFRVKFEKERSRGMKVRRMSVFLRTMYFLNLCIMLGGMAVVSIRQNAGYYQEDSITVDLGDTVWDGAIVRIPTWLPRTWLDATPGELEEWTLVYAFFNGVYEFEGDMHDHRPVYRERRKFDRTPYEGVVPAEIKYCGEINAWVLTHESIFRTKSGRTEGCNWLLRSPPTETFDLLEVEGNWQVWVSVIAEADVSIAATGCQGSSDCNFNGDCIDGQCNCYDQDEVEFLGTHCEVRLKENCKTIIGEHYNSTWSVTKLSTFFPDGGAVPVDSMFQQYSRPGYDYIGGDPEIDSHIEGYGLVVKDVFQLPENVSLADAGLDVGLALLYSGNRWIGSYFLRTTDLQLMSNAVSNYHAFWNRAFRDLSTAYISDTTKSDTPVGVDMFAIGERGEQFGPFGALYPLQQGNQTGRGYFRCSDSDSERKLAGGSQQKMGSITHNSAEVNRGSSKGGMLSKIKGSFTAGQSVKSGKTASTSGRSGKTAVSKKTAKSATTKDSGKTPTRRGSVREEAPAPQSVAASDVRSAHSNGVPTSITALVDAASCITEDISQQQPHMLGMEPQNHPSLRGSTITYGTSNAASRALANLHIGGSSGDQMRDCARRDCGRRNRSHTGYSNYSHEEYGGDGHAEYCDESGGGIFDDAYMRSASRISVSAHQPPPPDRGYNRRSSSSNAEDYGPGSSRGYSDNRRVSNADEYMGDGMGHYSRRSSGYSRRSSSEYPGSSNGDAYPQYGNPPPQQRHHSIDHRRKGSGDYSQRRGSNESHEDTPTNHVVNNTGRDSVTKGKEANRSKPSPLRQGSVRSSSTPQNSQFSNDNPAWFNENGGTANEPFGQDDDDRTMATMATKDRQDRLNKAKFMSSPAGDVTICFTDVQGSTSLWETCPSDMKKATDIHDTIMRQCYTNHQGYEITTEGDAFNLAFQHPIDALSFALQAQLKLYKADWPEGILQHADGKEEPALKFRGFRVRFGIHHGPTNSRVHDMTGRTVYSGEGVKIARAMEGMCHGGQILTTMETWKAVSGMAERYLGRPQILDCGEHLLFETTSLNPSGSGHTTTRYTRRIMQLVPAELSFDFFEARGRRDIKLEDGKTGFEIKDASVVDGRLFPPLTSKRQLTTCFLNAPYANGRVTICFVNTVGLDDNPDNRAKNLVVLAKYLRKQLLLLNPPGYECQEDNGCWMLAFDRMAHAVTFGLALKSTLESAEDLVGRVDREGMFKVGILSGPFTSMGPHKITGMADYFGPIVNRAARVASNCEPGQVCVGIPLSEGVTADPPDFGPTVNVRLQGIKKLKGVTLDVACFDCSKRRIETLY
ncbi:hypothetical protein ACHAXT_005691 [Thalassiosira profunda]